MTLGELLKKKGRSQKWFREQLQEQGIKRDPATISLWCSGKQKPRDEYLYKAIAKIIGSNPVTIKIMLTNGTKQ